MFTSCRFRQIKNASKQDRYLIPQAGECFTVSRCRPCPSSQ
nr:MAG TPA: hypothetical protein [Caudoviricetes sp.]